MKNDDGNGRGINYGGIMVKEVVMLIEVKVI